MRTFEPEAEAMLVSLRRCVRDAYRHEQWALTSLARDRDLIDQARALLQESRALLDRADRWIL